VARGSLTAINAPRGTGKSAVVLGRMVDRARAGLRVLYLDRDNSPATLRKRLVGFGARDVPTLRVLTRESAPALADTAAWGAFPLDDFDTIVCDSWDSFAEGAGEQDSRRSTLALAPLLDVVRRERAPGVVLLCNVRKDGAAGRGSGIVEDRMDNVWEARDVTGFVPTGRRPWWEELPPAARSDWASRATRHTARTRPERIRLALIASKFRDADDPAPIVLELDFSCCPWAVRDVTTDLLAAGAAAHAAEAAEVLAARERAAEALAAELARRAADGGRPLLVEPAVALLVAHDLKRRAARELLKTGGGGRWRLEALDGRAVCVRLIAPPRNIPSAAQFVGVGNSVFQCVSGSPNYADRMDTRTA
jgi:AAA domain-containing protein